MDKFEVGEVAILVSAPGISWHSQAEGYIGTEVTIDEALGVYPGSPNLRYGVVAHDGVGLYAPPIALRKKKPKEHPRQETTEWKLCAWKPSHITV